MNAAGEVAVLLALLALPAQVAGEELLDYAGVLPGGESTGWHWVLAGAKGACPMTVTQIQCQQYSCGGGSENGRNSSRSSIHHLQQQQQQ